MKITRIETYSVSAEWKNWLFVKVCTDTDLYGIAEGVVANLSEYPDMVTEATNIMQAFDASLVYNNVSTALLGVPVIYGTPDTRTGLTSADGSPVTIYTTTGAGQVYRVQADLYSTAAVTGTATYTVAWTENSTPQSITVTATSVNVNGTATALIRPDSGTTITGQLTGVFTGTFNVVGLAEEIK